MFNVDIIGRLSVDTFFSPTDITADIRHGYALVILYDINAYVYHGWLLDILSMSIADVIGHTFVDTFFSPTDVGPDIHHQGLKDRGKYCFSLS